MTRTPKINPRVFANIIKMKSGIYYLGLSSTKLKENTYVRISKKSALELSKELNCKMFNN